MRRPPPGYARVTAADVCRGGLRPYYLRHGLGWVAAVAPDAVRVRRVRAWIAEHCKPTRAIRRRTSPYGPGPSHHWAEFVAREIDWPDDYPVAHGDLLAAALEAGYTAVAAPDAPVAYLNLSLREREPAD